MKPSTVVPCVTGIPTVTSGPSRTIPRQSQDARGKAGIAVHFACAAGPTVAEDVDFRRLRASLTPSLYPSTHDFTRAWASCEAPIDLWKFGSKSEAQHYSYPIGNAVTCGLK